MKLKTAASFGTVIVTGADCGVGPEVVTLCLKAGYDVLFTYRSRPDRANELLLVSQRSARKVKAIEADLQASDVAYKIVGAAARLSPIVGLVNNDKSTPATTELLETTDGDMRSVFGTSVVGSLLMCKAVISHWCMSRAGGAIVNVTSTSLGTRKSGVSSAASSGAIEAYSAELAREFASNAIRVNVVRQGVTRTKESHREDVAISSHGIPMRRLGHPIEVAEAVTWMLSPKASYVTGTVLPVAGGAYP